MGFLKKNSAPSELPDLAMESLGKNVATAEPVYVSTVAAQPLPVSEPVSPQPVPAKPAAPAQVAKPEVAKPEAMKPEVAKPEVAGEDYLEFSHDAVSSKPVHDIKKVIDENLLDAGKAGKVSRAGFFDKVLDDINGELEDVGKLEDWYEKKFAKENVVSNMKGYWEGNKADIIIESFGAEYKRQINDKVKVLQELEEDWREIYFRLVKKEEEMKKEERELKETLGEFVNLCKRRKGHDEEEKGK